MSSHLRKFLFVSLLSLVAFFGQTAAAGTLNVVKLLPDPARPQLYAINNNGKTDNGSILVIDTLTHATIKEIAVGKEPTDIDLTENSAELLVMNTTDKSISRIDLTTLAVTTTYQLTEFSNNNNDSGGHVADGPGNVIYYVDEQSGPRLRVYDTSTGKVLQTFGATSKGIGNDYGFGDMVVKPDKSALFGWVQFGDGAGWGGSFAVRYNIATDGTLTLAGSGNSNYPTTLMRDPLNSPALISADGSQIVIKNKGVDQTDMNHFPVSYPDTIYSMSPNGKIVATSKTILPGAGGEILYTLPVTATVQAMLPDYSAMVYFNPATKVIAWLDLVNTLGSGALGLKVQPTDGAVVANPSQLEWFPITGISRYQVYLGTDRSVVESATPASASYLGEATSSSFTLTSPLVSGQTYFWKVVPIGTDGLPSGTGTTRSFRVSTVTLSRSVIAAESVEGVSRHVETISLQSAVAQAWSATADVPWITFDTGSGSTPGNLTTVFNASALKAGTYTGNITVTTATDSLLIPVSLRLYAANFMISEADLELPWVYVVSQESNTSSQPSFLLRIDTATNAIVADIPCGRSVTDLAIHYAENRIYLTNWQTGILRAFDRDTFQQVQTYQFAPVGPIGYGEGGIWRVAAGKKGRLILEESDQWIDIRLIDTANGAVISTNSSEYAGDGEADPTGRYYYHVGSSNLKRFDLSADTLSPMTPQATARGSSVVMIGDGSKIAAGSQVFDPNLGLEFALPSAVIAGTLHGDLLFTSNKAYNGSNGLEVATLPVTAPIMSVTGDQKKLYLFPANSKAFQTVELSTIAALPSRDVTPSIADSSTVIGTDQALGWSIEPFATSYKIYFGTNRDAVVNATESSAEYLGSSLSNSWTGLLPTLTLDGNYFWRVDVVGFSGTRKGPIWAFRVAPLDVTPRAVDLAYPASSPVPIQRLIVTSPASGPLAWTASTTTPWIKLLASGGSGSGNLNFEMNTAGLALGQHQGSITFQAGGETFSVPVGLRIIALNVTKLVAHPTRPVVYGINTAGVGDGFSRLLEIDASTGTILRTLPIGFSPTDADLDAANERMYITNWGYSATRVIDLVNWTELPSLALGTDVYKLEVTPRGRIVTEGEDQWVNMDLWNSTTGAKLSNQYSTREGDGESDPTGKFYYHCDNNNSDAKITKYDISADSFVSVATSPVLGYGSRNLILSGDGSKLFWQGRVFDSDLKMLTRMPDEIYATNQTGDLVIGASQIWWSDSGTSLTTLPFTSTVATVSSQHAYLVRFDATAKTIQSTAISNFTDLPGPFPRPGQTVDASPTRLSWSPVAGAISYRVFIAPNAIALAAMTVPVATVDTTYYDLATPLAFGKSYSWRVDAVTPSGTNPGKVQSFTIRFPEGPAFPVFANNSQGATAVSMTGGQLLIGGSGAAEIYHFDPATGSLSPLQNFSLPGYYTDHYFGTAVAVDADKVAVGAYSYDSPVANTGAAFVYQSAGEYAWKSSGPLTLPNPQFGESFAQGIAASGNMMLAGTGYSYNHVGRVAAYITEPGATAIQTFSASDAVLGDGFGQAIAMDGNQAIIAAPGRGASYNRLPGLYAFSRSTTTGLWTQIQKIAIPGANTNGNSGTVVALSGNFLATNNGASGTVEIFTRNGSDKWLSSATIKRSDFAGSTSSFGNGLALTDDQLFIGDPGATNGGKSGGVVFSFRRSGNSWVAGPVISPHADRYSSFGGALAVRDGWLLASGSSPQPAWLFRVDAESNHIPRFSGDLPSQLVAGRAFTTEIQANDVDGNDGLTFDIFQGPAWLQLANEGNGKATLTGTPDESADSVQTVQIRVRDTAGAQALYTYQLSLLAATSVPVLTLEPTGGDVGEGQEMTLRAAVTGIGPFKWQWYLDGVTIPGANGSTLGFGEIGMANSGAYSVSVDNAVGRDESAAVTVAVHPAERSGGDWPTFGGSTRHTGFHPARLGKHVFVPAWSQQIHSGNALNRVAVADGRVFVSATSRFETSPSISALDLETGDSLWTQSIPSSNSVNPPTWHDGTVYFQRGKGISDATGPQLIALDAATGDRRWASVFGAQWESYEAPAVTDSGIYINGGAYGGMYGFGLDGTQTFFRSLAQYDGWTPTVSDGHLYSWVAGDFQEHNPLDGSTIWSVSTGWNWNGWTMNTVAAVSDNSAVVISTTEMVCIDLPTHSIRWRKTGNFQGSPAISNGMVYGIQNKMVVSYSLTDGSEGATTVFPEAIISRQPLLVMDYLFVASVNHTYVVDRATSAIIRTLSGGGLLSFADAHLFAAGTDGILRAWYASPALHFTSDPMVAANDRGDDSLLDLKGMLFVPDGAGELQWKLLDNSNPALFSIVQLDENGVLQLSYTPYVSGSAIVWVEVKDGYGWTATARVRVTLPALPEPLQTVDPAIVFSRANGLYEQTVTVKNMAARAIGGFEVQVSGFSSAVSFYNATSKTTDGGLLNYNNPVAAGESVAILLQYYAPQRGTIPQPGIVAVLGNTIVLETTDLSGPWTTSDSPMPGGNATAAPPNGDTVIGNSQPSLSPPLPFAINDFRMEPEKAPILEFEAAAGYSYRVQYSDDMLHWKYGSDILTGIGNVMSWTDSGPPLTESAPAKVSSRFYRIERIKP